MQSEIRITWKEKRPTHRGIPEWVFVIADQTPDGWSFSESSSWEVRWYPVASTKELSMKADAELRKQMIVAQQYV